MKKDFRSRLENFWYHHKIGTIITVTFTAIFIICAVQLFSRTDYGLYAMYAGPANINVSATGEATYLKLESAIRQLSGDSELECSVQCFTYVPKDLAKEYVEKGVNYDHAANLNTHKAFLTSIANGKDSILLLTPELYAEVKENGALTLLSTVLDSVPASSSDGYGIPLGETDFYKFYDSLSEIPADTILCLRNLDNPSALIGKNKANEAWKKQVEIFREIVEFEVN